MIRTVIIDDEINGRFALRQKLRDYCPEVEVVGEAPDGSEGIELIRTLNPEVVFLDIEMPGMNGFEMLIRLPEKKFHLIFTTAYDHYAIKAIKFAAFDYLLKPIDIDELKATIAKVTRQMPAENTSKRLETLEQNFLTRPLLHKIAIPTLEGLLFFDLHEILRLEAESNYTILIFTDHRKLLASRTLKDFEEILPAETFFRAHNSHLINLQYIRRYIKGDGGQVEMQNGDIILVSRRKKEEFLKRLGR